MPKTQRTRSRLAPRGLALVLAAAVLTVSGATYAAAFTASSHVKHTDVFKGSAYVRPTARGGENILLIGSDDRTGLSRSQRRNLHAGSSDYGRHTDTIMIAHIGGDGSLGFVSIPRDSYVEIPAYTTAAGHTVATSHQKINAAYDIGGPRLTVETVEKATGVPIDHYLEINFAGFVDMVDALGGVPVTTADAINDEKSGLDIPAGTTTLSGPQALAYVRARYFDPSADLGRMKRQQAFLSSLFSKATSPAVALNPARLLAFANAAASSITVDEEMGRNELWGMIAKTRATSSSDITFQTVPLAGDELKAGVGSVVVWDEAGSSKLFALLNSDSSLNSSAGGTETSVAVSPAKISIQVFNGSAVSGLGSRASAELETAGYSIKGPAKNAAKHDYASTVVQYDPRYDVSLNTLRASLPNAKAEEVEGLGRTFNIIIGSDYAGVTPVRVAE